MRSKDSMRRYPRIFPVLAAALLGLSLSLLLGPRAAAARSLFTSQIVVGDEAVSETTNKIGDVEDFYSDFELGELFSGYVAGVSPVLSDLDIRGLRAVAGYADSSPVLNLFIPGVLSVSFAGSTRTESAEMFEDWLQGELAIPGASTTDLLQALVAKSPVDPVAGNPNSLQTKMLVADWNRGVTGPFFRGGEEVSSLPNLFGLGASAGYYRACERGCMDVSSIDIPLSYAFNFANRKLSLIADLPLAATFTEGQWSAMLSLGLGAQYHVTDWWNLTAMARGGGVGSIHVGALAILYSFAAINHMEWNLDGIRVGMGNQFGFVKTVNGLEISGIDATYDLTNEILRNGAYVAGSLGDVLRMPLGWEIFGNHTHFFGSDLYVDDYGEAGAALTVAGEAGGTPYDAWRLWIAYMGGHNYNGVNFGLGFRF